MQKSSRYVLSHYSPSMTTHGKRVMKDKPSLIYTLISVLAISSLIISIVMINLASNTVEDANQIYTEADNILNERTTILSDYWNVLQEKESELDQREAYLIQSIDSFNDEFTKMERMESDYINHLMYLHTFSEEVTSENKYDFDLRTPSFITADAIEYAFRNYSGFEGADYSILTVQNQKNVNAIFLMAIMRLETGNGTSSVFINKNNVGGFIGDSGNYMEFDSVGSSIVYLGDLLDKNYLSEDGRWFKGYTVQDVGYFYCENPEWYKLIGDLMYEIQLEVNEYYETVFAPAQVTEVVPRPE